MKQLNHATSDSVLYRMNFGTLTNEKGPASTGKRSRHFQAKSGDRCGSSEQRSVTFDGYDRYVRTLLNRLLALLPTVDTAARQTTMIRASMTAYSTAVGPSSDFRNRTTDEEKDFIGPGSALSD